MKLKANVSKVHYNVEVPKKFLRVLMDGDRFMNTDKNTISERLHKSLEGIGCEDIDWGGMFGPYIFFAICEEKHRTIDEIKNTVLETIEYFVSKA